MDILDLAKSLPKLSAPPEIIVPGLGLEYISSQAGDYVAPELTERSPAMSAVQLITAPAARREIYVSEGRFCGYRRDLRKPRWSADRGW